MSVIWNTYSSVFVLLEFLQFALSFPPFAKLVQYVRITRNFKSSAGLVDRTILG
ncbi:MAG: hypothetical protein ACKOKE_03025 [Actinomycetota bacterium]